jgi:hypothetical protein
VGYIIPSCEAMVAVLSSALLSPQPRRRNSRFVPRVRRAMHHPEDWDAEIYAAGRIFHAQDPLQAIQRWRALCTQRNAVVGLCRVPAEVFVHIVLILLHDGLELHAPAFSIRAIGGVCTHIRRMILEAPVLWSNINLRQNVRWLQLCVERSQSALLSLSYSYSVYILLKPTSDGHEPKRLSLLATLLPRAHHLELKLTLCPSDLLPELFSQQPGPTVLRALNCSFSRDGPSDMFAAARPDSFPLLKELTLQHAVLSDHVANMTSLTHLNLYHLRLTQGQRSLIEIFKNAPGLQFISLEYLECYRAQIADETTLVLPHLKTFRLSTDISTCLLLLRLLPLPREECTVAVTKQPGVAANPDVHLPSTRDRILDILFKGAFVYRDDATTPEEFEVSVSGYPRACLVKIQMQGDTRRSSYSEPGVDGFLQFDRVLRFAKTLQVHGDAVSYVFSPAASDPALVFPAVKKVVIENGENDFTELTRWLHARTCAGKRLHIVNFRERSGITIQKQLIEFKHEVMIRGLAEIVLQDGELITIHNDQ